MATRVCQCGIRAADTVMILHHHCYESSEVVSFDDKNCTELKLTEAEMTQATTGSTNPPKEVSEDKIEDSDFSSNQLCSTCQKKESTNTSLNHKRKKMTPGFFSVVTTVAGCLE